MNIHEELFVKNFIIPQKRERYLEMLCKEKTRSKILNEFRVNWDLDKTFMVLMPPNQQLPENIYKLLKEKGAPQSCYVISDNFEIDKKEMSLNIALENLFGGTFISCMAGKLGYFESDEAGEKYILERK